MNSCDFFETSMQDLPDIPLMDHTLLLIETHGTLPVSDSSNYTRTHSTELSEVDQEDSQNSL